ncbi:hypothetical protein LIER_25782 [Lithospermum erythrorhizon]|uniref:Ubiquitin-like domain-containing protein n=1 Tax=Lithospermum erythrorhizon TaxID=34254 RepID=A0AAV3R933_LITER
MVFIFVPRNGSRRIKKAAASKKTMEVVLNDRTVKKKLRVKCHGSDTIGDLKKVIAAKTCTRVDKIRIKKLGAIFMDDRISLKDYMIHDGVELDLFYN